MTCRTAHGASLLVSLLLCTVFHILTPLPAQTTKVQVAYWARQPAVEDFRHVMEAFHRQNSEIEIDLLVPDPGTYLEKVMVMLASGVAPDVLYVSGYWLPLLQQQQALLDLSDFIHRDNYDLGVHFPVAVSMFQDRSQTYALPYAFTTFFLRYNKGIFDNAGLLVPPGDLSSMTKWTWKAFLDTAKKATQHTSDGQLKTAGVRTYVGYWAELQYWLWQNGASILDAEREKPQLLDPRAAEGYQFWVDLVNTHRVAVTGEDGVSFAAGSIAMVLSTTASDIPDLRQQIPESSFAWDFAHLPWNTQPATPLIAEGFAVTSQAKQPDAAWRVLSFLCGPKGQEVVALRPRNIPAARSAALSPVFLKSGRPNNMRTMIDAASYARAPEITLAWNEMTSLMSTLIRPVFVANASLENALSEMNRLIERLLSD
jgi:multiple sugar transport system substrate-binding protein